MAVTIANIRKLTSRGEDFFLLARAYYRTGQLSAYDWIDVWKAKRYTGLSYVYEDYKWEASLVYADDVSNLVIPGLNPIAAVKIYLTRFRSQLVKLPILIYGQPIVGQTHTQLKWLTNYDGNGIQHRIFLDSLEGKLTTIEALRGRDLPYYYVDKGESYDIVVLDSKEGKKFGNKLIEVLSLHSSYVDPRATVSEARFPRTASGFEAAWRSILQESPLCTVEAYASGDNYRGGLAPNGTRAKTQLGIIRSIFTTYLQVEDYAMFHSYLRYLCLLITNVLDENPPALRLHQLVDSDPILGVEVVPVSLSQLKIGGQSLSGLERLVGTYAGQVPTDAEVMQRLARRLGEGSA